MEKIAEVEKIKHINFWTAPFGNTCVVTRIRVFTHYNSEVLNDRIDDFVKNLKASYIKISRYSNSNSIAVEWTEDIVTERIK